MQRPVELSAESLWTEVSNRLRDALSESTFTTWFADTEPIELSGEHFVPLKHAYPIRWEAGPLPGQPRGAASPALTFI